MHTILPVPHVLSLIPNMEDPQQLWLMLMTCMEETPLILEEGGHWLQCAGGTLHKCMLESPYGQCVCRCSGRPFRSRGWRTFQQCCTQLFCTIYASDDLKCLFAEWLTQSYQIHFTHGDLLHNILGQQGSAPNGTPRLGMCRMAALLRSSFQVARMLCWKDIICNAFPRYEEDN